MLDGSSVLEGDVIGDNVFVEEQLDSNALKRDDDGGVAGTAVVAGIAAQSSINVVVVSGAKKSTFPTWMNSIASHGASGSLLAP